MSVYDSTADRAGWADLEGPAERTNLRQKFLLVLAVGKNWQPYIKKIQKLPMRREEKTCS